MNSLCTSAGSFNRAPRLPEAPKSPRYALARFPSCGIAPPHVTFPLRVTLFVARDTTAIRASRSRSHFDARGTFRCVATMALVIFECLLNRE